MNSFSSLSRQLSTSSPAFPTLGGHDIESQIGQEEHLEYSTIMADLIPILALIVYVMVAICIVWKYVSATAMKEWVLFTCYRRGYQRRNKRNRYPGIDREADGEPYTPEDLDLSDNEGEDIQLLRHVSGGPTLPVSPQQRGRDTEPPPSQPSPHVRHLSNDDMTSLGIFKYFHPDTGRLRDDISNPTQTALDGMCEDEVVHGVGPWYRSIQRISDGLILKAQAWLDKEDEGRNKRQRQEMPVLCDGESNRTVRRILLERREEEIHGDGEDDLY